MKTLAAVLFAIALAGPAAAQSTAGSSTRSNQSVRSQNGAAAIVYNGGGGGGTTTIRNTPDAYAPGIVGGNTCSAGVTAGLALPGVGITGGASYSDKQCELRQKAAMLWNMGFEREAVGLLCAGDKAFFDAFVLTGRCKGRG